MKNAIFNPALDHFLDYEPAGTVVGMVNNNTTSAIDFPQRIIDTVLHGKTRSTCLLTIPPVDVQRQGFPF